MKPDEVEAQTRDDVVWQRPTWPLGSWGSKLHQVFYGSDAQSPFFPDDVREALAAEARARAKTRAASHLPPEQAQALETLDLTPPVTFAEIKRQYKILVKRLHPDANGGDKAAEEQLKLVNQAYTTLKAAAAPS